MAEVEASPPRRHPSRLTAMLVGLHHGRGIGSSRAPQRQRPGEAGCQPSIKYQPGRSPDH